MRQEEFNDNSFVVKAVESAKIGVWHWNIDTAEIIVNDAFARTIGYTTEELNPIPQKRWFNFRHPDEVRNSKKIAKKLSKGQVTNFLHEFRLKHKDGSWINVQSNGSITEVDADGNPKVLAGTMINISELFHSRQNLQYRYEIEKLVAGISSDFVGIQHDKINETINKTLEKIGRFSDIDRSYIFLLRNSNTIMNNTQEWCAPDVEPQIEFLQDMPVSIFPWWMKKLNNLEHIYVPDVDQMEEEAAAEKDILQSQSILSLLVVPIHYKKSLLGFMGFDSVKHHKAWPEADIHLLETVGNTIANALNSKKDQELLIKAKEEAEESNRLKSAFLATMNHELRTPLHHILGFSELMKNKRLPPEQNENFANKIYESGKNLLQIIEDILSLALVDQSDIKIRNEVFRGIDLFIQHKSLLEEILVVSNKQNEISLNYNPSPEFLNNSFIADRNKINQVILNLFKNAIKFTNNGTIEYGVSIDSKNQITFYVKDSGIGIPKHQQELIFDFFRQADDTHTRLYSGIGIGLAISKKISNILNGNILVDSHPGSGSKFSFLLPVQSVSESNGLIKKKHIILPPPNFSGKRILLIDDDKNNLFLLKNLLDGTNAEIFLIENEEDPHTLFSEASQIDLIIFDLKMPEEKGFLFAQKLKEKYRDSPMIALTAHSLLKEKEKAIQAGCSAIITKPVESRLLYEAIESVISK